MLKNALFLLKNRKNC